LIKDLHQHPGHGHQDEIAIDDVAELMRHHGAGFILAQELEQSLGHHDAGIRTQQAIGESRGIVIGDEADARRRKAIVLGHLMDQSMHDSAAAPSRRGWAATIAGRPCCWLRSSYRKTGPGA
jgi:hypothetical protein